jgi:hypothetical protein
MGDTGIEVPVEVEQDPAAWIRFFEEGVPLEDVARILRSPRRNCDRELGGRDATRRKHATRS